MGYKEVSPIRSFCRMSDSELLNLFVVMASPTLHYKNIFAILETFRQDGLRPRSPDAIATFQTLRLQFHLYTVNHAFPKIAARILMGGLTWEKHPMDALADYNVSNLRYQLSFPHTLRVDTFVSEWLRVQYSLLTQTSSTDKSGYSTFEVTANTVGQWVKALTDTFVGLRNALITEGRSKNKLTNEEMAEAVRHSIRFQALLRSRIANFLLSDASLSRLMGTKSRPSSISVSSHPLC